MALRHHRACQRGPPESPNPPERGHKPSFSGFLNAGPSTPCPISSIRFATVAALRTCNSVLRLPRYRLRLIPNCTSHTI